MPSETEFQSKVLRRSRTVAEYKVYRAGLEWDLTDPIVINSEDDFKSAQRWRERVTPYHHQVTNLITFCRRLPVTLLADDVGLGKTISAGLIVSELIARARVSKVLVVCPKVLGPQWKEELESKFDIPAVVAIGKDLARADFEEIGAVITTYNSARLHMDSIPEDRFQMLILDEAHKLRNLYGVEKTPQVAKRFRNALAQRRYRFVLMLTATPIQNRLWDIYSLVDLLTVARGHQNPFGSEGMFARRFIADKRDQARRLNPEAQEEFRSIVYGYMSRVRRGDAKLYFPERVVQMHHVVPTAAELELINVIAKPIQKLNKLVQISILQALASSPEALSSQLANMARNETIPPELASDVKAIVARMPLSSKLLGLKALVAQLKTKDPSRWRLVVFTTRRETQTTIQNFLEGEGLTVGIINGDSGTRNQETIARFRLTPPACRVIVSTEAGSEGINLQVANVLVNYDLPWNPMVVEQRIGRIQRLASDHAHVSIFNIMLKGTFEEYIVGRLMEKLQMAAHAVGDVEALLQGADVGEGDADGVASFEDKVLELVLAALAGKDVEKATQMAARSIEEAKAELEREEASINSMLGSMDDGGYVGPRAPDLPPVERSMGFREFVLSAFAHLGAKLTHTPPDLCLVEERGTRELIRFEDGDGSSGPGTLYVPGAGPVQRLVSRVIATGVHDVKDLDTNPIIQSEKIANTWASGFGGKVVSAETNAGRRLFEGKALLRVRATVAHDSYERLVEAECAANEARGETSRTALGALPGTIEAPSSVGIDVARLSDVALVDPGIDEFSRFYLERREQECHAASDDERKRKKLFDEFTPRIQTTLVGLEGVVHREVTTRVRYQLDAIEYESTITTAPVNGALVSGPPMKQCSVSGKTVPQDCLGKCAISGDSVLNRFLARSDISGRYALEKFTERCALSGGLALKDEVQRSDVTGNWVSKALLKKSVLSGKVGEPQYFKRCEFTGQEFLNEESGISQFSGKAYRLDQENVSALSGKKGHINEFVVCHETRQTIGQSEAEKCEETGKWVRPGVLVACDVTAKRVLNSELARCNTTKKRALRRLLVTSSISQEAVLRDIAVQSMGETFCSPAEAKMCVWSGREFHPDDLRTCSLTGLTIQSAFTASTPPRLRPLAEILDGSLRAAEKTDLWDDAAKSVGASLSRGSHRVQAAVLSPTGKHLAISTEVKTFFGMRTHYAGGIYSISDQSIIGRAVEGRRSNSGWTEMRS